MQKDPIVLLSIFSLITGIILLIFISDKLSLNSSTVNSITKEESGKSIKIVGKVLKVTTTGKITSLEIEDNTGKIPVILFNSKQTKIDKYSTLEIDGKIALYDNKPQIYAQTIKVVN